MFPEIPVEFLQEKEVFKEFIYRINTLGRPRLSLGLGLGHLTPRRLRQGPFSSGSMRDARPVVRFAVFRTAAAGSAVPVCARARARVCAFNPESSHTRLV